jgi:hypothetical protein
MLRAQGHDVVGLDTFFYRGCDFGSAPELEPSLALDLRDVSSADLQGFDAIVHLGALSNDPLGDLNSSWTYEINRDGTVALARAAKKAGAGRFVFASSCSMYGASGGDEELDETSALRPVTPYAESKVAAEIALGELEGDGFSPVFMRNATVYACAWTSCSTTWSPGRTRPERSASRATERHGGLSSTYATSQQRRPSSSTRRPSSCRVRRSTSAAPSRTTASATSPKSCGRDFQSAR